MKILILGQNGMLGHVVDKYMVERGYSVDKTHHKWPSLDFENLITKSSADFLINCIGRIPQKNSDFKSFLSSNTDLPIFLAENFRGKIIHPTTDCEFAGSSDPSFFYEKDDLQDANDSYGKSKIWATQELLKYLNVKVIRTSIIGPEIFDKKSLWEWFVGCENPKGFVSHFWNGITTLQWAKEAEKHILSFEGGLTQVGANKLSKFELLNILNEKLHLGKKIQPLETLIVNKCLKSDYQVPLLREQIFDQIKWQKL
jgi:dTDP-4-dehydrorhamnose reductase